MPASAKVLADSVSPAGVRLTSLEVTFARSVLAEFNTHRMLSKSSASSRAVPHQKMIERVRANPYIPAWTRNQKGMSGEPLDPASDEYLDATYRWLELRDRAVEAVQALGPDIHKQDINRVLEPWMWHTVIVTATEWSNFDHLRDHPKAHPAMQAAAKAMIAACAASTPRKLDYGQWHMPLIFDEDVASAHELARVTIAETPPGGWRARVEEALLVPISVGRCARVSYLTHDGKRDHDADIRLHDELRVNGHMAPYEHVARPLDPRDPEDVERAMVRWGDCVYEPTRRYGERPFDASKLWLGNFRGWVQARKLIPYEHDILGAPKVV